MRMTIQLDGVEIDRAVKPFVDEHYRITKPIDASLTAAIKEAVAKFVNDSYMKQHLNVPVTDNHVELAFHVDTRGKVKLTKVELFL